MTGITRLLGHGRVYGLGTARVAVHFLSNPDLDGEPLRVILAVAPRDGTEHHVTLHEGDTFSVGGADWRLESVEGIGTYDYAVRIVSVDSPGPKPAGIETAPQP